VADIPTPRSRSQILGAMIDALLSRVGVEQIQTGGPVLSTLEAAAQSDVRNSQDIFNLLGSASLDRATGQGLDRIGADESIPRISQGPSSGVVTVTDTSITKISSSVYQGGAAPIVGSTTILVESASLFPASGSLYIGRGTVDYEGPIPYSATTNLGTYWSITLSSATTKFHNLGESVVVAQGGNRPIPIGTLVRTPQGNANTSVQFGTTFAAVIPDGESVVLSVPATAAAPGSVGNVSRGSIVEFVSPPFPGASVTNSSPFSGGLDTEDDDSYRERIRQARNTRTKGTPLALESGVVGVSSVVENNRVLNSSFVTQPSNTLYIDDGSGYEEITEGIAFESVVDLASGGENYFSLANGRPVSKAFLKSTLSAPFALTDLSELSVEVGGTVTTHVFNTADFPAIGNASAAEVASSINSDSTLLWSARTAEGGSKVSLFAKADTSEYLQVLPPNSAVDANLDLGFTSNVANTLWLYKDDRILTKDGAPATLTTKPKTLWSPISNNDLLVIKVDGIEVVVKVRDIDFVNAGTPYVTVSVANSIDSWATLFNFLIPGVTTVASGSSLVLTSNKGRSSKASLEIVDGVIGASMFDTTLAVGLDQDYTLNRNLGQFKLTAPLLAGQRLTAGSLATRSFVSTPSFASLVVGSAPTSVIGQLGAELWFVVDGAAKLIPTSVGPGVQMQVALAATASWGKRVRYQSPTSDSLFDNVVAGDWVIATDSAFADANRGAFRVVQVAPSAPFYWVEVEQSLSWSAPQTSFTLSSGGMQLVETGIQPQRVFLGTAGNPYTATSLAASIQSQLDGGTATVNKTTSVRVRTNTFEAAGDIAVVAANTEGLRVGFPVASSQSSGASHLASLVASHSQDGTPSFITFKVASVGSASSITLVPPAAMPSSGAILEALKTAPESPADTGPRWGNDGFFSSLVNESGNTLNLRSLVVNQWLPDQRLFAASPFAISARDQLGVIIDGDSTTKRYVMNMYRKCTPGSGTYGGTNVFRDADNGGASLAQAFGTGFDWTDFAVHMKARTKANGIMWRYYRHGPDGNYARLAYSYPVAPNAAVGITASARLSNYIDIRVSLASSGPRTLSGVRNTSYFATVPTTTDVPNNLTTIVQVFNLPVASGAREIRLDYISGAGSRTGTVTDTVSSATATVVADGGTYITITGVSGTFGASHALTFSGGGTATSVSATYGYTTLNLTSPANTGLLAGGVVWLQSSDVNFNTGPKTLVAATGTSISYRDFPTTVGSISGTLTVSQDPTGEVSLSGAGIVAGDIVSFNGLAYRTLTVSSSQVTYQVPGILTGSTLTWTPVVQTSNLQFYPLNASANSTSAIIASVGAIPNSPVSGFEYTPGTISWATYESPPNGLGNATYVFSDGLNFVQSTNTPVLPTNDFIFTFKDPVNATLASGSDWANEDVRLVPITAVNLTNYMSVSAVGGLFSAAETIPASQAKSPQITTLTAGSAGSINVTGGSANSLATSVMGNGSVVGSTTVISASASGVDGLAGETWVYLQNTIVAPKAIINSSTVLTDFTSAGEFLVTTTKLWKYSSDAASALVVGGTWQVEHQGAFVAYVWNGSGTPTGFASVQEGDWVAIDPAFVDPTYGLNGSMNYRNRGIYRVVRTEQSTSTFWIENAQAIKEVASIDVAFLDYNSLLPNDTLHIGTTIWGQGNVGVWSIKSIDTTNQYRVLVDVSNNTPVTVTGPIALGSQAPLVQTYESVPTRLIKRVLAIVPSVSANLADIKLDTTAGVSGINETYGTVISSLDKLGFDSSTSVPGIDGYSHSTGLMEEVNRTVYGDESQSSTYPGIAAASANIYISGPIIKRIQTSISIRPQTGIDQRNLADAVRSAVAGAVNETPVGQSVALSAIVSAAQSVNGVVAVTILSPVYGTGNDLIPVQPYEKARVIDIEQDVQVSFVGV
jgi:uncharacterized phage protein gp47/JayE